MEEKEKCVCPECKIECDNGVRMYVDNIVFSCVKCEKVYITNIDGKTCVWFS